MSFVRPGRELRAGTSAVEVAVATLVGSLVAVPMLALLFQDRDTEQRSRYEYAALIAARDALNTARALAAAGRPLSEVIPATGATGLDGDPMDSLGAAYTGTRGFTPYQPEQKRIAVTVTLQAAPPGPGTPAAGTPVRLHVATATAKWLEGSANAKDQKRATLELTGGVLRSRGAP